MRKLLKQLNSMQRAAVQMRNEIQISRRFQREKNKFIQDHADVATKEQALAFIDIVNSFLDTSEEADTIRIRLQTLRREYLLERDAALVIEHYDDFKAQLSSIQYAPLQSIQDEDAAAPRTEDTGKAGDGEAKAAEEQD